MILHSILPTPALITPLDKEFDWERVHSLYIQAPVPKCVHEPTNTHEAENSLLAHTCEVTSDQLKELREQLPCKVFTCGDHKYCDAVHTRNLLYACKRPCVVVIADKAEELGTTIKFAQKYKIKLSVKNGGHSYAGYSLNCGGILVYMSRDGGFGRKGIQVDLDSNTVTIPAGCLWEDVHDYFRNHGHNKMVIGGRCRSVGVSGFILGGGVSPFSRGYGLGIDTVLKMNVVTASGEHVEVSHEDTDPAKKNLFWALRGGGGGNFGILTEFTAQLHDLAHKDGLVAYGLLTWDLYNPAQKSKFEEMMKVYNSTSWPKELTLDVIWQYKGECEKTRTLVAQVIVIYDGTLPECLKIIEPLTCLASSINIQCMKWYDVIVIEQGPDEDPAFSHYASLMFEEGSMTNEVVNKITKLMGQARDLLNEYDSYGKPHLLWVHIGEQTAKVGAKDTAFPWRNGVYVCYFKMQWTRRCIAKEMINFVSTVKEQLVPHTIGGKAAYVNFVDRTIYNWQEAYYGDNYPRLQRVKKEWDPDNFFKFKHSIKLPGITGPQIGTEGEGEGGVEQIKNDWDQYSLPEPEKIWELEGPSREKVIGVIREQVAPCACAGNRSITTQA